MLWRYGERRSGRAQGGGGVVKRRAGLEAKGRRRSGVAQYRGGGL